MEYTEYLNGLGKISQREIEIRHRASAIHAGVNQLYDGNPYSFHLILVAFYTAQYMRKVVEKKDDILPILFGAYFHDSIEDARLTYNDVMKIAKEYMNEDQAKMATEIVYALTNEKGRNRHERANDKYYEGIRNTKYAPLVKAADRMANYFYSISKGTRMAKCYKDEMPEFIRKALMDENGEVYLVPDEMIAGLIV